jgi:exodeoxyribonuclease V alpha subunit
MTTIKKTDESEPKIMAGELCRIVYRNDNNFLIGSFQGPGGVFTAIGSIINPQVNMEYELTGEWQDTARYGQQFKFSRYRSIQPVDAKGIFKYIVRVCKFVGGTVGNRLLDTYGEKTLEIMKTDPDRVAMETAGITLDRAKEIQKTLIDNEHNESVMVELEAMLDVQGMRKSLAGDLIHAFGNNAGDVIRGNPYTLTWFAGIGFALADRVALNVGYP